MKVLRLRALQVGVPLFVLVGAAGLLLVEPTIERSVEETGASLVGAKVEVDEADSRLREGKVVLRGLQVANPDAPFRNLLEAEEIVADIRLEPLLTKSVVVDTLAIRGIRFNTPRETSGALEDADPSKGQAWREVNAWAESIDLPEFTLQGLGGVIDVDAIDEDSLASLRHAVALRARTDSLRDDWQGRIRSLDPRPWIDSARVLSTQLKEFRPTPLNLPRATELVRASRDLVARIAVLEGDVIALDSLARGDLRTLRDEVRRFESTVDTDMAYARRLLKLPSLTAPSLPPSLFGETAIAWLKPVLYWVRTAERYLPPGLDPRQRPGPKRARAAGTTVAFPGRAAYPRFLLEYGALDLVVGGAGIAAGSYSGAVRGLSSAPAKVAQPVEIEVFRSAAVRGPRELAVRAVLRHAERPLRDSVALVLNGLPLPAIDLGSLNATLLLGRGDVYFSLSRVGESISARLRWISDQVEWARTIGVPGGEPASQPRIGSEAWARDFLWRTLSGVRTVELDMGIEGSLRSPALRVRSNLSEEVARSLERELGSEVRRAERELRAEIDRRVSPRLQEARTQVDAFEGRVVDELGALAPGVREVRAELEQSLQEALRRIPQVPR